MRAGASEVLGYAAQALLLAGHMVRPRQNSTKRCGSRTNWPSACTCRSSASWRPRSRVRTAVDAGDASVRRAIEEAKAQQAPWLN